MLIVFIISYCYTHTDDAMMRQVADNPANEERLKRAMEMIAESTKDDKLLEFLKTGTATSNDWEVGLAAKGRPIGLTNIANTCYLNSLLQVSQ
jgi:ubiquitin C-terminal hydrolase